MDRSILDLDIFTGSDDDHDIVEDLIDSMQG